MTAQKTPLLALLASLVFLVLAGCGDHSTPPDDGTPPSVTIQTPHEGDSLSAIGFTLRGIASDDEGLAAIRLIADGTVLATAASSPFSFRFPSVLFDEGDLTITVQAEDTKGAKGSASVDVHLKGLALRSIGSGLDQEREPAWSSDGTMLAFSSEGASGNRDIYVVDAMGGEPTQITTSMTEDISPDWSPNGSWIAFASNRTGNWDIWVVDPMGTEEHQVTTNGMADRGPVWSPNGMRIAFHSSRDGNWNLYAVPFQGDGPSGAETPLTAAASAESSAAWSADGSTLAFATNQLGGSDIFTVAPPSLALSPVPGANDGTVRELDPAWSPEGNYLLFSDNRNGNSDIWVLDPSTNRKRVLAAHLASDREPAWSPGGDRIAFSSNRNGTYDIWILE